RAIASWPGSRAARPWGRAPSGCRSTASRSRSRRSPRWVSSRRPMPVMPPRTRRIPVAPPRPRRMPVAPPRTRRTRGAPPRPGDYAPTFDALARRWRVWIRAAEAEEGELQTVAVTLRQGPALRASRWLRSATPVAVVESRLRAALESERQPAVATLAARITAEDGGSALLEA